MLPFRRNSTVYITKYSRSYECVEKILDKAALPDLIGETDTVLIKPNLVESLLPPITTPVELIGFLVEYLLEKKSVKLVIGEGTGAINYDTWRPFKELGYIDLAERLGVELIDLNEAELVRLEREDCHRWPAMFLPEIVCNSFLISVPVLKAHTLAGVTLSMKNMMGVVPPSYYRNSGSWKKSAFHERIHEAVADLNRYRSPDFTLLDATVGMPQAHIWGPVCEPPIGILAACSDPVAIDAYGANLLERRWQNIGYIKLVNNELGRAFPLDVEELL